MRCRRTLAACRGAGALSLLLAVLLCSCYQARNPPSLDEAVRVSVVSDRARLVQAQASLQTALAASLTDRLGWQVSPLGSARLAIDIERELIDVTVRDARGVPTRWSIRLQGTALLTSQKATLAERFTGVGYSTGLLDEAQALQVAANNAAFTLTSWLETQTKQLR